MNIFKFTTRAKYHLGSPNLIVVMGITTFFLTEWLLRNSFGNTHNEIFGQINGLQDRPRNCGNKFMYSSTVFFKSSIELNFTSVNTLTISTH